MDAGYLVPFFLDEALPGDTFNLKSTLFGRMATLIRPIMDNVFIETHFFSVPIRLIWDNWQRFNGEQRNPGDSTDYLVPTITGSNYSELSLEDYMGLPTGVPVTHSALFHRAYNLVYAEWFKDQNLQNSPVLNTGDGPDDPGDYALLRRGKRHDYFTSCLPWPQKGDSVSLPIGDSAPVSGDGNMVYDESDVNYLLQSSSGSGAAVLLTGTHSGSPLRFSTTGQTGLITDLSSATATTINSLRQAFQIQKLLERDARGGTRYTEIIRAHFGVINPDLNWRPEYLGGGSTPLNVSQVPNTTGVTGEAAQGDLSAYGTFSAHNHGFVKSFTEHCIVIGLVSIRADLNYQQGLDRMWSRRTRWDFYWPALSHIGEQAVLNKEIYVDGTATDEDVFGYQERHAEYRYKNSKITGRLRSTSATPLDVWHLAQDFAERPTLSSTFIEENPPVSRVVAVPSEPQFIMDCYFDMRCARPMPVYGVPGLIDHF
jgi:hypothetical protein